MNKISSDIAFIQLPDVESAVIHAGSEPQQEACEQLPFCLNVLQLAVPQEMQQEVPQALHGSDTQDYQLLEAELSGLPGAAQEQDQPDLADENIIPVPLIKSVPDYIPESTIASLNSTAGALDNNSHSAMQAAGNELQQLVPDLPTSVSPHSPLTASEAGGKVYSSTSGTDAVLIYQPPTSMVDNTVEMTGLRQPLSEVNNFYQSLARTQHEGSVSTPIIPKVLADNRNHMVATGFEHSVLPPDMDASKLKNTVDIPALLSPVQAMTTAVSTHSTTAGYEWRSPALDMREVGLGKKLTSILGDKIHLQMGHSIQRANIRLDPPNLGLIEIQIITDGDRTKVQLFSANAVVRDVMLQNIDQLRTQLAQKLGMDTSVEVGSESPGERDQKQAMEQAHTIIAGEHEEGEMLMQLKEQSGWINRLI